jgi:hypothetical protein
VGGDGGTATNGDLNIPGEPGAGTRMNPTVFSISGRGASSILGQGGREHYATNNDQVGENGSGYGSGGGGGLNDGSASAHNGGNGAQGIIIIYEFS